MESILEKHSGELLTFVLAALILGTLLLTLPALLRWHQRYSEMQHAEHMRALEQGKASNFSWPSAQAFFNTVRTHTMEGMFADPIYGGNKDFAGWRLIGFPGAQPAFSPADLASKEAYSSAAIIGLQASAKKG